MSAPLVSVFNIKTGEGLGVLRQLDSSSDALTCHQSGEEILSGESSIGYLGFDSEQKEAGLCFGYPYVESPKRYIRKLTLIDPITTFARLNAGESKTIRWKINGMKANDYGSFVSRIWEYCFDEINPQTVVKAYALLKADGVLSPIRGQGFVVARGASELCRGARQEMFQSRIEETLEEAALGRVSPDEMTQMLKSALAKTVAKYYPNAPIAWGCDSEK